MNKEQQPFSQPKIVVSIVKLESYDPAAVDCALSELLEPLGGIGNFVEPGEPTLLKPNLLAPKSPASAVCTHPEIIRGVGRLARQGGASQVEVTDSPGFGSARKNLRKLGIGDSESLELLDADDGHDVEPGEHAALEVHRLQLSRRIVERRNVINLPKAKTHGQMVITGAVKNMYGAVVGLEKAQWHYRAGKDDRRFARLIVHVHELTRPCLNILDAVVAMEGNGPGSGDPRPMNLLAASNNAYALDAVMARLMGLETDQVPVLAAAADLGLLPSWDDIELVGPPLAEIMPDIPWKMARPMAPRFLIATPGLAQFFEQQFRVRPKTDQNKCTACGRCHDVCAAGAITIDKDRTTKNRAMIIDYDKCISCFCCQEICPEGAIDVQAGTLARWMRLGTR